MQQKVRVSQWQEEIGFRLEKIRVRGVGGAVPVDINQRGMYEIVSLYLRRSRTFPESYVFKTRNEDVSSISATRASTPNIRLLVVQSTRSCKDGHTYTIPATPFRIKFHPLDKFEYLQMVFHSKTESIRLDCKMSFSILCAPHHPRLLIILVYRVKKGGYFILCFRSFCNSIEYFQFSVKTISKYSYLSGE